MFSNVISLTIQLLSMTWYCLILMLSKAFVVFILKYRDTYRKYSICLYKATNIKIHALYCRLNDRNDILNILPLNRAEQGLMWFIFHWKFLWVFEIGLKVQRDKTVHLLIENNSRYWTIWAFWVKIVCVIQQPYNQKNIYLGCQCSNRKSILRNTLQATSTFLFIYLANLIKCLFGKGVIV